MCLLIKITGVVASVNLSEGGARTLVFDVFFFQPSDIIGLFFLKSVSVLGVW